MAKRLREARLGAGFRDATSAARRFGWTVPTYLGHENGTRGFTLESARAYAHAYDVDMTWLLTGEGSVAVLKVEGYVGPAGAVMMSDTLAGAGPPERIAFPGVSSGYALFKVRGQGNFPVYRNDDLLLVRRQAPGMDDCIGRDCIVRSGDGRTLLRQPIPGPTDGLFTLMSFNATPEQGMGIKWAWPVEWVRRASTP